MYNPHQELLEKFEALYYRIDNLEGLIKEQLLIKPIVSAKDILFTKKQLAEYWQCHEQTITQKKLKGQLPFIQHGRKLLFSKNAIDKLTTVSLEKRKGAVI